MAEGEKQRQLEAGVRDLEELRRIKTAQESSHELAKSAQASAHQQELEALRQRLEPQLAELEKRLASRDTELREAREAAELSLLQLHQVQEELEHYFLADAEKQRQLEAGLRVLEELRRSKADQESNHEQVTAAQERAHEEELQALRLQLEPRLAELEQRLAGRDAELREAREAAELSLLQLHQVQEELEHYFLADAEKQRQLEAGVRDLEELRRIKTAQVSAHELAMAELEQGLANMDTQLREAREEAGMNMQQLHQAQEELEHYFLKARADDQLAQAQLEQLQRAQNLMLRLQPDVLPNDPYPPALAVEVLSELPAAMPDPSLQTQALLSTYAASLQRASALLERARRL
jgi:chromosome segregation ATPase